MVNLWKIESSTWKVHRISSYRVKWWERNIFNYWPKITRGLVCIVLLYLWVIRCPRGSMKVPEWSIRRSVIHCWSCKSQFTATALLCFSTRLSAAESNHLRQSIRKTTVSPLCSGSVILTLWFQYWPRYTKKVFYLLCNFVSRGNKWNLKKKKVFLAFS